MATPNPTPPVSAIAVSPNNPDFVVVGHNDGQIYLALDGTGTNPPMANQCSVGFSPCWSRIDRLNDIQLTPTRFVTRLAIDETRGPNWIYATFGGFSGNNVYVTKDLGVTWIDVSGVSGTATDLPSVPVRSLAVNPVHPDFIYVGTEVGIFASEDAGVTWSITQDGPANVAVDELFWHNGYLHAATFGRGLYTSQAVFSTGPPCQAARRAGEVTDCPCSGRWQCPCGWNTGYVPTSADDVGIGCITVDTGGFARNLRINGHVTMLNGAGLNITEDLANFGSITKETGATAAGIGVGRNFYNAGPVNIGDLSVQGDMTSGGIVALGGGFHAGSLSMSSSSTLTASMFDVSGNCANSGIIAITYDIRCHDLSMGPNSTMTGRYFSVGGDLANSGTMVGQILSAGSVGSHVFSGSGAWRFGGFLHTGGTMSLGSDVTWAMGYVNNFEGAVIDFGNRILTYTGNDFGSAVPMPVTGTGTLRFAPASGSAQFGGNGPAVTIASGIVSGSGTIGAFTIDNGATFAALDVLTVSGDVTNNGALTKLAGSFPGTALDFTGNGKTFTNNGSIGDIDFLRFYDGAFGQNGPHSQFIAGTGSWAPKFFSIGGFNESTQTVIPTTVTLMSDANFSGRQLALGIGSEMKIGIHTLTYNNPKLFTGKVSSTSGIGLLKINSTESDTLIGSSFGGPYGSLFVNAPIKIASGTVKGSAVFPSGQLTIDPGATLSLGGFFGMGATGNVTNNGTVNVYSDNPIFRFEGSTFTNNGNVTGNMYASFGNFFGPPLTQNLGGTGSWAGNTGLFIDTTSTTTLINDVTYDGGNLYVGGRLNTGAFRMSLPCTTLWQGPGEVIGNIRRTNLAACPGAAIAYGNPFSTIRFTSGTAPDEMAVNVALSAPSGFAGAINRTYLIAPTGGSGYTADLRLHYLDTELNGNAESTLNLWRNDGTSWNLQGATNRNTTDNWVEYAGVTQFSPWTFSSSTNNPSCTFSLDQANRNFVSDGGSGSVIVTSQPGCAWTAVSSDPGFITVTSSNSGTGNGTVNYSVSPNVGPARSGTIGISGQTFTITQDPGCSFLLSPTAQTFSSAGGSDNITVNSACDWIAASNESWILITSGSSGTGDGTIAYSVIANAGAQRTGTITVTPALGSPRTFSVGQGSNAPTCATPPSGMVSWWPGAGNANDVQGTNHGTMENGVTFVAGEVGQAFGLDGVNDSVLLPAMNIGSTFTLEFWIYPTVALGDYQHVASNSWTSANYGALYFYDNYLEYYQDGEFRVYTGEDSVPLNTWTHVALTYDSSVDRIYVNGSLVATSSNHTETFNNQMRLGFTTGSPESSHFQGLVDEATLFGRALTIAEVQLLYLAGNAGKCQVLTPTPTNTPTPTAAVVSGTVTYGNALGLPTAPRFVPGVLISATGSPAVSDTTGASGTYSLTGFGASSYTITPSKSNGQNGSITSFDAAKISQYVVGGSSFTAAQAVVADVSGMGGISSFDAALIARYVASLPPPNGSTGNWIFSPASNTHVAITTDITGENYAALLMGDVSGNYVPAGSRADFAGPENSTAVAVPRLIIAAGYEVTVPVTVAAASNQGIISYEIDLRYDPRVIQPQANPVDIAGSVSSGLSVVTNAQIPGFLRIIVYGATPIQNNGVLLNLRFTAIGSPGSVSPLTWERILLNEGGIRTFATDGQVEISPETAN
jgi:hypothetical protein